LAKGKYSAPSANMQRIPWEMERQDAYLYEMGAGAYPEFMAHTDEFSRW